MKYRIVKIKWVWYNGDKKRERFTYKIQSKWLFMWVDTKVKLFYHGSSECSIHRSCVLFNKIENAIEQITELKSPTYIMYKGKKIYRVLQVESIDGREENKLYYCTFNMIRGNYIVDWWDKDLNKLMSWADNKSYTLSENNGVNDVISIGGGL